ncbi:MFS transporter [Actinomycetes bacterium KLBMP 9759]
MTTPGIDEPRFRDALRGLPARVWVISAGILVNRVGNFLPVFIVLYLAERGFSSGAAGLVLGVSGLGNVLGNTVGGHLADRIGRRWTIVLSAVPTAGLTALVPALGSFPAIVAVVGLIGVTSQVYRPAAAAVLLDSVTTHRQRLAAFGVFRFAMNLGAALGGVIGGVLASTSYVELFLVNAALCLLFGVVVAVLLRDAPRPAPDRERDTPAPGYRRALADRTLMRFLLMTVVGEFVYVQSTVGLPLHVSDVGMDARDFGLLIGINGLLVLALELPITGAVARYRPEYVLAAGNLLIGAGLALTGFMTHMVPLAATVVLWTLGEMLSSSVAHAHLGSLAPPRMAGRYQGLYGAAYTIGTGAGPIIGGAAYALGPWVLWVLVGVAGLVAARLSLPRRTGPRHHGSR